MIQYIYIYISRTPKQTPHYYTSSEIYPSRTLAKSEIMKTSKSAQNIRNHARKMHMASFTRLKARERFRIRSDCTPDALDAGPVFEVSPDTTGFLLRPSDKPISHSKQCHMHIYIYIYVYPVKYNARRFTVFYTNITGIVSHRHMITYYTIKITGYSFTLIALWIAALYCSYTSIYTDYTFKILYIIDSTDYAFTSDVLYPYKFHIPIIVDIHLAPCTPYVCITCNLPKQGVLEPVITVWAV